MTWPTSAISTQNLDAGADNPALARAELKTAVDNINSIAAEFGNLDLSSPANLQLIQYNSTTSQWATDYPVFTRYSEQTSTASTTAIDFNNGNVQRFTLDSAPTFTFTNFPDGGTVSLIIKRTGTAYTATWPANAKFAFGNDVLGIATTTKDIVVISYDATDNEYLISINADYS